MRRAGWSNSGGLLVIFLPHAYRPPTNFTLLGRQIVPSLLQILKSPKSKIFSRVTSRLVVALHTEFPLLRKACRELYPPGDMKKGLPRIIIVIVGKRHHTRFYPTAVTDADRSSNPKMEP